MDKAFSGKTDSPCFKQNQTALFFVQRRPAGRSEPISIGCSEPMRIGHSELMKIIHSGLMSIDRSELKPNIYRHQLGTANRDPLGTPILIGSEQLFSSPGIRNRAALGRRQ